MTIRKEYDATVVGGGPAGLQAALTLGRMHRSVLLLDAGTYRNDPTGHLHNFIGRDGTPPAELRAIARAELAAYETVEVRDVRADVVRPAGSDFVVETPYGPVTTRLGRVALLLERIASRLVVLTDGGELDAGTLDLLERTGVEVRTEPVAGFERSEVGARVSFVEGPDEQVGGVMVGTTFAQSAPFAEQLGLTLLPSGCVEVDPLGRTSLPGVLAAGDLAHTEALPMPMASVLTAAAAGLVAATAADAALMARDHGLALPA